MKKIIINGRELRVGMKIEIGVLKVIGTIRCIPKKCKRTVFEKSKIICIERDNYRKGGGCPYGNNKHYWVVRNLLYDKYIKILTDGNSDIIIKEEEDGI